MTVVTKFEGEYQWASNFFPAPFVFQGICFPTSEHAYQFFKTNAPQEQQQILQCATPGQAKRLGQRVHLRSDWSLISEKLMRDLLVAKFSQNQELQTKLLATGQALLIEGNHWHDNHWGICECAACQEKQNGENLLGKLLMSIREQFTLQLVGQSKK